MGSHMISNVTHVGEGFYTLPGRLVKRAEQNFENREFWMK